MMDPDEALAQIRQLVAQPSELTLDQFERLAELVQGLDDWLTRGGFLPRSWNKAYSQHYGPPV